MCTLHFKKINLTTTTIENQLGLNILDIEISNNFRY